MREWFTTGEVGPADMPWVDIHQARWMDSYAGTRIGREPAPLAGIATGSVDDSPRVARVTRGSDPFSDEGAKIENPELGSTETIDLIFVLAVLIPLLIGAMGVGCGSMERESGIDRLIAVQRGRASDWFLAQSAAIFCVVAVAVQAVVLAAAVTMGAFGTDGLLLALVALLYTALWSGILTATAVAARSLREATLSYGGVWVLLVILAPALQSELAFSKVADDPGLQGALDTRKEQYETYDTDLPLLVDELYRARPELVSMPLGFLDEVPRSATRHVYDWHRLQITTDKHRRSLLAEREADFGAMASMAWSPASTLTLAAERLAGRDLTAAMEFRTRVMLEITERMDWVLDATWGQEPLGEADFDELLTGTPKSMLPSSGGIAMHVFVLLAWAAVAWSIGVVRVRRREPGS